jgi:uncharacterized protein YndB with AHSA1/START domain
MDAHPARDLNPTDVTRASDRELVVTRTFRAPARAVFAAWTQPELLKRWWTPPSCGLTFVDCETDVRVGGRYRFVFAHPAAPAPMEFFGRYVEVIPGARVAWTNEEGGDGGQVTTVTFEERGGETRLTLRDAYPTKEALDEAISSGSTSGFGDQFAELDGTLGTILEPA